MRLNRGAIISIAAMLLLLLFFSLTVHVFTSVVTTVSQTFETKYRPRMDRACQQQTHSNYHTFISMQATQNGQTWLVRCVDGTKITVDLPAKGS